MKTTRMRARDLLEGLNPESEHPRDRKPEVKANPRLEEIIHGFFNISEQLKTVIYAGEANKIDLFYQACRAALPKRQILPQDVEAFSLWLNDSLLVYKENRSHYAGLYLTALADNARGRKVIIHTAHLGTLPLEIGYRLAGASITVMGDCKDFGARMDKGSEILIKGNAESEIGTGMRRARIIIEGDVLKGSDVGEQMEGGYIEVRGNVYGFAGLGMESGTILIEGDLSDKIDQMKGGTIRVNGKRPRVLRSCKGGVIYHRDRIIYDGR